MIKMIDTKEYLKNSIIYEVYVRNHTEKGTFKAIEKDIDRIKDLGADIIWFMPIHPIGIKNKKGSLGCPYAIRDYRGINEEYGDLESFKQLVAAIHKKGMKVMIDVVYNHTSPDSILFKEHPEYFYKNSQGNFGNKVGEWYDVIDLDYNNKDLWDYQIDTFKYWANLGVDGFRCDVAALVPLEFWMKAREEVAKINPEFIWLAESCGPDFVYTLRKAGFTGLSDSELYNAFDITYDYDIFEYFNKYLKGEINLNRYLLSLKNQEAIYPANYIKLRFLENHDNARAKKLIEQEELLKIWTAFIYFEKGTTLLYGGQEAKDSHTPSLLDKDKVNWSGMNEDFIKYLKALSKIKKQEIVSKGFYHINIIEDKEVIYAEYLLGEKKLIGIFNVGREEGYLDVDFGNGVYKNLIDESIVEVKNNKIKLEDKALIFYA